MSQSNMEMSEFSVGYLVNKTAHYFKMAGLKFFKEKKFSITREQFIILYILSNENGISQRQLGKKTFKDRPNITRLIDILEQRGFIHREIDSNDRRIVNVFITDSGRDQVESVLPSVMEVCDLALEGLTPEEKESIEIILLKIRNNLEKTFKLQI